MAFRTSAAPFDSYNQSHNASPDMPDSPALPPREIAADVMLFTPRPLFLTSASAIGPRSNSKPMRTRPSHANLLTLDIDALLDECWSEEVSSLSVSSTDADPERTPRPPERDSFPNSTQNSPDQTIKLTRTSDGLLTFPSPPTHVIHRSPPKTPTFEIDDVAPIPPPKDAPTVTLLPSHLPQTSRTHQHSFSTSSASSQGSTSYSDTSFRWSSSSSTSSSALMSPATSHEGYSNGLDESFGSVSQRSRSGSDYSQDSQKSYHSYRIHPRGHSKSASGSKSTHSQYPRLAPSLHADPLSSPVWNAHSASPNKHLASPSSLEPPNFEIRSRTISEVSGQTTGTITPPWYARNSKAGSSTVSLASSTTSTPKALKARKSFSNLGQKIMGGLRKAPSVGNLKRSHQSQQSHDEHPLPPIPVSANSWSSA